MTDTSTSTKDRQAGPARTSGKAVAGFVLGLLSVAALLLLITGLPALVVGWLALRQINGSDGRLRGHRLAIAGMVLGAAGTLLTVVGVVALVLYHMREMADRTACQDNLRRIGQAVFGYEEKHREFPPAVLPGAKLPVEQRLSWLAGILPHLEPPPSALPVRGTARRPSKPQVTAEHLHPDQAWDAPANRSAVDTVFREYLCPDQIGQFGATTPGRTSYVGMAGVGRDAAALPVGDPRAGFFGYERRLTRKELEVGRGASLTLMTLETGRDNGPWAQGGPATVRGLDPAERPYAGPGRPFGGLHPGGFNALFADGSVEFKRDSIASEHLETLAALASP
jgi:prepilin-type processing-associated H-X9-DG protein